MKRNGTAFLWLLAAVLTIPQFALPSYAQISTFTLSGIVTDESDAVLPGATVTLRNEKTGLVREMVTDQGGRYNFAAMPVVGDYSVTVRMSGFATVIRSGLVFAANTMPAINFSLQIASVAETITVTGEAPMLETKKAELSLTIDQKKIETMPLNGRNYLDLANFSTGVNPTPGRGDLSINGQLGRNIDYVVDGVSNKVIEWGDASKTGLSVDTIEEFQVISSQFSAEFGHALGGIVSAVTKSGTNELHGTGYVYSRLPGLDADNPLTGDKAPFEQQQFGGVLGGPIVKDRTHFMLNYEGLNQDTENVVTSPLAPGAFPATLNRHLLFAKVTDNMSAANTFQGRFNYDWRESIGGFGGLVLADGGTLGKRFSWDVQGTLTTTLSDRSVNELRIQGSHFVNESTNLSDAPRTTYQGFAIFGGNPGSPQDIRENRIQLVDKLSHDFGAHRTVSGVDVSRIGKTGVFNADSIGSYTFAAGTPFPFDPNNPATFPVQFVQGFADPRRPFSLTRSFAPFEFAGIDRSYWNLAFYFQDNWEVSRRLTVNLGARYEKQTSTSDSNNIMPRLGLAYDVTGRAKTILRAGYGRFYDQLFDNIPNVEDLFGVVGNFSVTLTPGGNPGIFPTYPNILPEAPIGSGPSPGRTVTLDLERYAPELRTTPYSDQGSVGIQQELNANMAVSVDFTYVRGRDLFRTVDLNGPSSFDTTTGVTRTASQADATRPFGVPSGVPGPFGLEEGGFKQIRAIVAEGNSWYRALKVNFMKRFSRGHSYQIAYTWSKSENEQDDFGSAAQGADPQDFLRALAAADVPHTMVANGVFQLGRGIWVSGIYSIRSGETVDPLAGVDLNGDGFFTDRPGSLERNSFRAKTFNALDMTLGWTLPVGAARQVELRFDIFNVFDSENVLGVNSTYGTDPLNPRSSFLAATTVGNPRQFQAAFRYRF